uniref:Mitochondrial ribonuclease P catalytic subunit n=1 Tax=Paramormyrops kingsleyae TaxID=1676925 RepID=A0A3B3SBW8_9TELE|nr:mitochondrial ribonuclease P catalytic subunit isoform X1 [Paramormyrops kingsleyae]
MSSLLFPFVKVNLKQISPLSVLRPWRSIFLKSLHPYLKSAELANLRLESTKEGSRYAAHKKKAAQKDSRRNERQPFSRSVFAAGTASRTAEFMRRKSGEDMVDQPVATSKGPSHAEVPDCPLTVTEWASLKQNSLRPHQFEVQMMKRMVAARSSIDIAKSLLTYVAVETGTLNYELLLKYLTLCVHGNYYSEVFDLYEIMKSHFKTLDPGAYSLFIKVFSTTDRWRESFTMLESLSKTMTPSPRNYGDVIAGALQHGDSTTAWALYDRLLEQGLSPNQDTWQALFKSSCSEHSHNERLRDILLFMRDNQLYPGEPLAQCISSWFESLPADNWTGSWTTAGPSGTCQCCGAALESIRLSEEEYGLLKDRVMRDVIMGRDVFTKTTPQELDRFRKFVESVPAFDVVLDGLNVANTFGKGKQSETLLAVATELEKQGLNILVLGRSHMRRHSHSWDRDHMTRVQQVAHCFFTDDISEDDPFLLYAALHSGNHCMFVSRDLMRDHKACLADGTTRCLFFKWQRGHQLVVHGYAPGRRIRFQRIQSYDTILQTDGASWHIPYDPQGQDRCSYEVPTTWLCLRRAGRPTRPTEAS